jgi:hypothetical protein
MPTHITVQQYKQYSVFLTLHTSQTVLVAPLIHQKSQKPYQIHLLKAPLTVHPLHVILNTPLTSNPSPSPFLVCLVSFK